MKNTNIMKMVYLVCLTINEKILFVVLVGMDLRLKVLNNNFIFTICTTIFVITNLHK
jgi:hypothetical protein